MAYAVQQGSLGDLVAAHLSFCYHNLGCPVFHLHAVLPVWHMCTFCKLALKDEDIHPLFYYWTGVGANSCLIWSVAGEGRNTLHRCMRHQSICSNAGLIRLFPIDMMVDAYRRYISH